MPENNFSLSALIALYFQASTGRPLVVIIYTQRLSFFEANKMKSNITNADAK